MSNDEIKGLIGKVFDERIDSAITKMTNEQDDLLERIAMLSHKTDKLSVDETNILQTEINNLYIAIKVLKSLIF